MEGGGGGYIPHLPEKEKVSVWYIFHILPPLDEEYLVECLEDVPVTLIHAGGGWLQPVFG